jgi:5'-methylthioadenosine phosphorylase
LINALPSGAVNVFGHGPEFLFPGSAVNPKSSAGRWKKAGPRHPGETAGFLAMGRGMVYRVRMDSQKQEECAIGVIGGSGLYEMDGLGEINAVAVSTPFGDPSDRVITGRIGGRKVCFLPRHGVGHRILPHEINHRANLWALRSLGVRWLVSVTAVGSLREEIAPRHLVVPDQLIDRTGTQAKHTFFGKGIAAHVGFADPYCADLRRVLSDAAIRHGARVHDGGTYVCMNGPAFSTRAEAHLHRMMGGAVIGMTNGPEVRLAREAEISAAALALVTDYDCWKEGEADVEVEAVIANLRATSTLAKQVVRESIALIPHSPESPSHRALDAAIFTPRDRWPEKTTADLAPILGRFG